MSNNKCFIRLAIASILAVVCTKNTAALTVPSPLQNGSLQRVSPAGIHTAATPFTRTLISPHHQRIHRQSSDTTPPTTSTTTTTTLFTAPKIPIKKKRPRPVVLSHERDFFRQDARLDSMSAYVLVSTLTASMSFGCLVSFIPIHPTYNHIFYRALCLAIQLMSGMSSLFGIYATIVFSLTILYCRSALGAERDREFDIFLRRTTRARVDGARCFSWSLGTFSAQTWLVLVERTSQNLYCSIVAGAVAAVTFFYLYRDWKLLFESKEIIYD